MPRPGLLMAICSVIASLGGLPAASADEPAAGDFFEREIRPLLLEKCGKCHGAEKQWGGLRLDSRATVLKGGDSGAAVLPGKPEESLLIEAVRQTGDIKMPPKDRLTDHQVDLLVRWVSLGAPWPGNEVVKKGVDSQAHWAFQPVRRPAVPVPHDAGRVRNPIDAFVVARLEQAELPATPQADRRTLIRRISYDLTGLPPSADEVERFVNDPDPEAYPRLVERLLDSPHYGEHWGRHWLDVARYSDTKGYVYGREERFFFHAAAYRDWVVRALNDDLPYDRFLLLQIAADQVEPRDSAALPAMGFLTLGRRFLGVTHDIIDDRIDVVSRGTMGLTVGCARCHDHKYDPIPTSDYYSLYGVFQSCCEKTVEFGPANQSAEAEQAFVKELEARQKKRDEATTTAITAHSERARAKVADYLFAQRELQKYPEEGFDQIFSSEDLLPDTVRRWEGYLAARRDQNDPVFRYWFALGKLPDEGFDEAATAALAEVPTEGLNSRVARVFASVPASPREVADRYGRLLKEVDDEWKAAQQAAATNGSASPERLSDAEGEALRQALYGIDSPCVIADESIASNENVFDTATRESLWRLQGEIDRWLLQAPATIRHTLILADRSAPVAPRIFKRGNPANRGEIVPRQFLSLLAGAGREPFRQGSGRLELAQAIISPQNPLTARVWVNRIWSHHFGAGLVRTPSDFGVRAEIPSHPELLDWLASELVARGWSTKAIHRLILLSATYQQSSFGPADPEVRAAVIRVDPENRLLWRMNAHRLSFEEVRDTMLAVSGQLDRTAGGRAADLFSPTAVNRRRTLYGLVDRQFVPSVFRVFDFANPDLHIPQRAETTVPQQALFSLNHPFVAAAVRSLAELPAVADAGSAEEKVRALYRQVLQREPTERQLQSALAFIAAGAASEEPQTPMLSADWKYGFGHWHEATDRIVDFQPLPHFTGMAWQGGSAWPDGKLGWVQLTGEGGHAGNDLQHAAVRRWTAPVKGTVAIESLAVHDVAAGDGIRCRIISSRQGTLATSILHNAEMRFDLSAVEVEAGETIDFVVDFNADLNSDQFLWPPRLRELSNATGGAARTWDATKDFDGNKTTKLNAWEQLAQVLLLGNEVMFVD